MYITTPWSAHHQLRQHIRWVVEFPSTSLKYTPVCPIGYILTPRAGKLDNIKMNKLNALASKYIRTTPPKHVLSQLTLNDKHSFKFLLF